jgi:hypothetical protein
MYPGRRIICTYYGNSYFWVSSAPKDEFGKFLVKEVANLYSSAATEYLKTRDISVVERKFREYYEIPKPKKEVIIEPLAKELFPEIEKKGRKNC